MRRVLHFPSGPTAAYRDDGSAFYIMLGVMLSNQKGETEWTASRIS